MFGVNGMVKFDRCLVGSRSCSGISNGYIYAIEGLSGEKIDHTQALEWSITSNDGLMDS